MGLLGIGPRPDPSAVHHIYRQAWPPPRKASTPVSKG